MQNSEFKVALISELLDRTASPVPFLTKGHVVRHKEKNKFAE